MTSAPEPERTFVVLGSSLTGLAVARIASRSGLRCVVLDTLAGPAARSRTARFLKVATTGIDSVRDALSSLAHGSVTLVADGDRWLRAVCDDFAGYRAEGWVVLHPGPQTLGICLNKSAFLAWCAARGLPAPRLFESRRAAAAADEAVFPLMIRPEWTQHASGGLLPKAIEVREPAQLRYWLDRYAAVGVTANVCDSLLTEGVIQYSVGAARDAAGRTRTFLAEKVRPLAAQCAGGTFMRPAKAAHIEALATRTLDALDFFGVGEVEILYDPASNRASLVEVNARPWLQFSLPHACGCDLLSHALGRLPLAAVAPARGRAWLYFASDLYACFSRSTGVVRNGALSPGRYLSTLAEANVYATWDRRDPWPLLSSIFRRLWAAVRRPRLPNS